MSNTTPEDLARAVGERGTFSFSERLRGRAYASDSITINLNDQIGLEVTKLLDQIKAAGADLPTVAKLQEQLEALSEKSHADRYTVTAKGISSEYHDKLVAEAVAAFPYEYEEETDLLGRKTKTVIESPERTELFTTLIWAAQIVSIEDNEGAIDMAITPELIKEIRAIAPPSAVFRIDGLLDKVGVAVDWVEYLQDEDFFPKP